MKMTMTRRKLAVLELAATDLLEKQEVEVADGDFSLAVLLERDRDCGFAAADEHMASLGSVSDRLVDLVWANQGEYLARIWAVWCEEGTRQRCLELLGGAE